MKLRTRLTIIMLVLAVIPLAVSVAFVAYRGWVADRDLTTSYVAEHGRLAASRLESLFESRSSLLKSYSQIPVVQLFQWDQAKGTMMNAVDEGVVEKVILAHDDGTYYTTGGGNPYFGGLATSDNSSETATPSSIASRDYFKYLIYQNSKNEDRATIADPVISLSNSAIQVMVSHTVRGMNGQINGLIAGSISWDLLQENFATLESELHEKFGDDSRFMMISHSGKYVYHWDASKIIHIDPATKTAVEPSVFDGDDPSLLEISAPILEGKEDIADYVDVATGKKYVCAYTPIAGTDFSVCMFLPNSVMYTTVRSQLTSALIIIIPILVIVIIIARIFGGSIVKPLQAIANMLRDIAAGGGDLTQRLPIHGNDVVSEISKHFNGFCDSLS